MQAPETATPDLYGLRVLVTRPQQQAVLFGKKLESAGAIPFVFPCIDIVYHDQESVDVADVVKSKSSDIWIFTSGNAVTGALQSGLFPLATATSKTTGNDHQIRPRIAAIGQATLSCLSRHQIAVALEPSTNLSSEEFVATFKQEFTQDSKITIVRGDDGREVLMQELQSLGAEVHYLATYKRQLPNVSTSQAELAFHGALPCTISITSDLVLINLLKLIPESLHSMLFNCPVVVNSDRCGERAKQFGFRNRIETAHPPGDQGQIAALARLV